MFHDYVHSVVWGLGLTSQIYERMDPRSFGRSLHYRVYFGGTMKARVKVWRWIRTPIGRMKYLALMAILGLVYVVSASVIQTGLSSPDAFGDYTSSLLFFLGLLVFVGIGLRLIFVSQRLRDMGWSPWLAGFMFIPIVNLILGICCLFIPAPNSPAKIIGYK